MAKALFLDRDGVINVEKNYVYRVEDFEFVDGIFELCGAARDLGFRLIVITNQAGIARGHYTESDYQRLTAWMLERFAERGIVIDRVYHCPYHPTAGVGGYRRESFDRKPNPGMILQAKEAFDLDLNESVLVGDKDSDIQTGKAAGVRYNLKLATPCDEDPEAQTLEFGTIPEITRWLHGALSKAVGSGVTPFSVGRRPGCAATPTGPFRDGSSGKRAPSPRTMNDSVSARVRRRRATGRPSAGG